MNKINQITNNSRQRQTIPLDDGRTFEIALYYMPMQLGWFIEEIKFGDFTLSSLRITNSPNMLHQFKNKLPFGLACISLDDREPSQQQDFTSGNSVLYVLEEAEVKAYQEYLSE